MFNNVLNIIMNNYNYHLKYFFNFTLKYDKYENDCSIYLSFIETQHSETLQMFHMILEDCYIS